MDGIRNISYQELNQNVELVKEVTVYESVRSILSSTNNFTTKVDGGISRVVSNFVRVVESCLSCVKEWDYEYKGNKVILWTDKRLVVEYFADIIADVSDYVDRVRLPFTRYINDNPELSRYELAGLLVNNLYKDAKVTKNGHATVVNSIRAVFKFLYLAGVESFIKDVKTQLNRQNKSFYVYKTTHYIANHYSAFAKRNNLVTCMSKGIGEVNHHFVECDKDLGLRAGVSLHKEHRNGVDNWVTFTANVDGFEQVEGVALFLLSDVSPDELPFRENYAFLGRAIGWWNGQEWVYTRYYGLEGSEETLGKAIKKVSNFVGMRFKAYKSTYQYIAEGGRKKDVFITPYIDGDHNFFRLDSTEHKDFIGRPYRMATVIKGHRSWIGERKLGLENPIGVYTLSQRSWLTEPVPFYSQCFISGWDIDERSAELVNGYAVHYKLANPSKWLTRYKQVLTTHSDKQLVEHEEAESDIVIPMTEPVLENRMSPGLERFLNLIEQTYAQQLR